MTLAPLLPLLHYFKVGGIGMISTANFVAR